MADGTELGTKVKEVLIRGAKWTCNGVALHRHHDLHVLLRELCPTTNPNQDSAKPSFTRQSFQCVGRFGGRPPLLEPVEGLISDLQKP